MRAIPLKDFLSSVKYVMDDYFSQPRWVVAEITGMRVNPNSRHCYLDLIEKDNEAVLAKAGGVIWKNRFESISEKFRESTGQNLKDGLKVMVLVDILFHEVYGFKLNINDIDPSYSLGEFALHRKKIIGRLEKEGLLELNKGLELPPVLQKIAVISSESAAGYEDFMNILIENPYGYVFHTKFFPAYMQGERTEKSIIEALEKCRLSESPYDAVIIIRGGGDSFDLHGFDNYALAKAIACFPIPVITGIGHRRDETVVDFVANRKFISPTAVAEFILSGMREFESGLKALGSALAVDVKNRLFCEEDFLSAAAKRLKIFAEFFLQNRRYRFKSIGSDFRNKVLREIDSNKFKLNNVPERFSNFVKSYIREQDWKIGKKQDILVFLSPANILKRGYSITFYKGKAVHDASVLEDGSLVETVFHKGKAESVVRKPENREIK